MALEDKKISSLPEWIYEYIQGAANMVVAHAGSNYRIVLSTLKQYVLGNRVIGDDGSMGITTNTDKQTLIEKRLDSPAFNNDVKLDWRVTATQMNLLSGLDVNVKQVLSSIGTDIFNVENSIQDLNEAVYALQADKIYSVGKGVASGETNIKISASSMSNDDIDPYSLSIFVYEQTSSNTMKLINLPNIDIITSNNILSGISITDVVPEKTYRIVIRYRLAIEWSTG